MTSAVHRVACGNFRRVIAVVKGRGRCGHGIILVTDVPADLVHVDVRCHELWRVAGESDVLVFERATFAPAERTLWGRFHTPVRQPIRLVRRVCPVRSGPRLGSGFLRGGPQK